MLTNYTLELYASEAYLEAHGVPVTADDLTGHTLIFYIEPFSTWPTRPWGLVRRSLSSPAERRPLQVEALSWRRHRSWR